MNAAGPRTTALRLVHFRVGADQLWRFRQLYQHQVIPALQQAGGCVYAALLQGTGPNDEVVSLTLWSGEAAAARFEQSSVFRSLLEETAQRFADPAEYRVQLSQDLHLEYAPVPAVPVTQRFAGSFSSDAESFLGTRLPSLCFRFVRVTCQEGKAKEFVSLYEHEVATALRALPGCRFTLLTHNEARPSEFLSLTVWETEEDAGAYERSGAFARLTERIKHTFSVLTQWTLGREGPAEGIAASSDDLIVQTYRVLVDTIMDTPA